MFIRFCAKKPACLYDRFRIQEIAVRPGQWCAIPTCRNKEHYPWGQVETMSKF